MVRVERSLGTRLGTEPTIRSHRVGARAQSPRGFRRPVRDQDHTTPASVALGSKDVHSSLHRSRSRAPQRKTQSLPAVDTWSLPVVPAAELALQRGLSRPQLCPLGLTLEPELEAAAKRFDAFQATVAVAATIGMDQARRQGRSWRTQPSSSPTSRARFVPSSDHGPARCSRRRGRAPRSGHRRPG